MTTVYTPSISSTSTSMCPTNKCKQTSYQDMKLCSSQLTMMETKCHVRANLHAAGQQTHTPHRQRERESCTVGHLLSLSGLVDKCWVDKTLFSSSAKAQAHSVAHIGDYFLCHHIKCKTNTDAESPVNSYFLLISCILNISGSDFQMWKRPLPWLFGFFRHFQEPLWTM